MSTAVLAANAELPMNAVSWVVLLGALAVTAAWLWRLYQ